MKMDLTVKIAVKISTIMHERVVFGVPRSYFVKGWLLYNFESTLSDLRPNFYKNSQGFHQLFLS